MTATILPLHRNTCRKCLGRTETDGARCERCAGSGVIQADKAMREHWGYRDGIAAYWRGASKDDSPFYRGDFADRCWRAGWIEAARAASRDEKVASEGLGPGDWLDRAGAIR